MEFKINKHDRLYKNGVSLSESMRNLIISIRHLKIDVYGKRQTASEVFDFTTLL
jgi:hypothetical protein